MSQLFTKSEAPRTPNIKRMTVSDAGCCWWEVHFVCTHCGHDEGWKQYPRNTLTELKRGLPCPKCNKLETPHQPAKEKS